MNTSLRNALLTLLTALSLSAAETQLTEMLDAGIELASTEGIFAAPEGAACVAAVRRLIADGFLKSMDRIVVFNTGSGYKYLDVFAQYWGVEGFAGERKLPASRSIGGIIGPY